MLERVIIYSRDESKLSGIYFYYVSLDTKIIGTSLTCLLCMSQIQIHLRWVI